MTQINASIPNLIGGVSQQPELLRLPSHMRSQTNGYASAATGLAKRPGTLHLGASAASGAGFYEMLDYGPRGVFWLQVNPGGNMSILNAAGSVVPMYDGNGNPISSTGATYLQGPSENLKMVKEGDTTFIINTSVPVALTYIPPANDVYPCLMWIKAGNYGRTYEISIPGVPTVSFEVPDGSDPTHGPQADTGHIARNLAAQLQANHGIPVGLNGSVIYLMDAPSGITMADGQGGSACEVIYQTVRSPTVLPSTNVPDGFQIKVEGGDATAAGDYYLQFVKANNVWREVRNPFIGHSAPSPYSMPHRLRPYGAGFQLAPIVWAERSVGDDDTNPNPSFAGKTINDLFFYQDRMALLSGEGFSFSETGEYFNFYRTTVTQLLDSDPVSGTITSTSKLSILRHAVAFGQRLFMFSDTAQFELQSDSALTPKTGTTQRVTDFECAATVRPVGLGTSLYFPVFRGAFTSIYTFFLDGIDSKATAGDVSAHVPEYIPEGVYQMVVSPVNNILLALSKEDPGALYVYQFYTNGSERLQSAWHRWEFGAGTTIHAIGVVGTTLYMLTERASTSGSPVASAECLDLTARRAYCLDRRLIVAPGALTTSAAGVYPATTSFTLPYTPDPGPHFVVVTASGTKTKAGTVKELILGPPGSRNVSVLGDLTGCTIEVGKGYRFAATLGCFFVREQAGSGSAGVTRGRTQVTRAWVNYATAGAFDVEVSRLGYPTVTYRCTTKNLGTLSATIGRDSTNSGRFAVPVMSRNTSSEMTLINDSPLPSAFLSVDWEGYHVSRGQHV